MGRSPCCDENGLKKGPWTPEEDEKLVHHIQKHGHGSWRALPKLAGLNRCGKSCRLRWTNYLRPDIKRGKFSQEEEQTILHLHSILGNKWSAIATHLPGRTDNEIKNFWNTHLKKKLIQMGFDPMTHQPRTDLVSTLPYLLALASMTDLMDHHHHHQQPPLDEHALRLQVEAVQLAKLQCLQHLLQSPSSSYEQNGITTNMELPFSYDQFPQLVDSYDPAASFCSSSHQGIERSQPLHHQQSVLSQFVDPPPQVTFSTSPQSCLNNDDEKGQQGTTNFAMLSQREDNIADRHDSSSSSWNNIIINNNNITSSIIDAPTSNNVVIPGDASSSNSNSTSSYGVGGGSSSYWPELFFVDPIMHDL